MDHAHDRYFDLPPGTLTIPIDRLRPSKDIAETTEAINIARSRMAEADRGERDRRAPISVRPAVDGFLIVDGNATYGAALQAGWPDLPVKIVHGPRAAGDETNRPMRILAIDGGGIRGVIPAMVLAELEKRAGLPICQLFDLIAGTSTGGIIALGLAMSQPDGTPAYTAAELVGLYECEGARIFARPLGQKVRTGLSLLHSKYRSDGIDAVLHQYFGEARISAALTDVMVPAYDIEQRARYWFKARKARADAGDDVALRDAARATSAAPTYFAPARVARERRHRALVDGGVYVNNPAMAAYVEACDHYATRDIRLVSIGTGELTRPLAYERARHWGVARWARPILDVVFDGVSDETHHSLRKLLGSDRYLRIQTKLQTASDAMDDAGKQNIHLLKVQGEQLAFDHRSTLNDLGRSLAP